MATSFPVATMPQPSAPAYCTPQLCTRSGTNNKGTQPCAASGWNCGHLHRWCTGRASMTHRPHLLQQSLPLGQGMHSRAMNPDCISPSGLLLQQVGADPTPDRAVTALEQSRSPTSYAAQALDTPTLTTSCIKRIRTPEKRCSWHPYQNHLRNKNTGYTQSTQGCSHIKTALQDHSR